VIAPDGGIVEDILPDALKYIPGTFEVDENPETPTVLGQMISYVLTAGGPYSISFDVQVTSTEAETTTTTNTATIQYSTDTALNSAAIIIHPYEGFSKEVESCNVETCEYVPMGTDVQWKLLITLVNIDGDQIDTIENPVVKDRFGGDLEVDDEGADVGFVDKKVKGKTEKVFLTWKNIGDLTTNTPVELWIEISTDLNTGNNKNYPDGHQEYTSPGVHYLNSGAVLKFIDPATGFQLSAHTPPLSVEAYDPATP
jgi:hypothetical protein